MEKKSGREGKERTGKRLRRRERKWIWEMERMSVGRRVRDEEKTHTQKKGRAVETGAWFSLPPNICQVQHGVIWFTNK